MRILIIEPNKPPYVAEIDGNLKSMQEIVGGYIEVVCPFDEEVALICNEEGKLLGLPDNRFLHNISSGWCDVIAGTFFLCACPSDGEDFESLSDDQIIKYTEIFTNN